MEQVPDLSGTSKDDVYLPPNIFVMTTYDADSMRRFAQPNDMSISNETVSNQTTISFFSRKLIPYPAEPFYEYKWDVSRYLQGIITFGQKYYDLVMWAPL